jgi:hypothetical protein
MTFTLCRGSGMSPLFQGRDGIYSKGRDGIRVLPQARFPTVLTSGYAFPGVSADCFSGQGGREVVAPCTILAG